MNTEFETIDLLKLDTVSGGGKGKVIKETIKKGGELIEKGWKKTEKFRKKVGETVRSWMFWKGVDETVNDD